MLLGLGQLCLVGIVHLAEERSAFGGAGRFGSPGPAASGTISMAWQGHCSKHTAQPVHRARSATYLRPLPSLITACSGQAAKHWSHSKQLPQERQRWAS